MFGAPDDLEFLRDKFFADRPIGIGAGMVAEEWDALEREYEAAREDGEDTSELTLEDLRKRAGDKTGDKYPW